MTITRHILPVILTLIIINAYSQVPSSCNVPAELQISYDADVPFLAIQRIIQIGSPYADSINISQIYQDSIWEGLAAIYNATSIPESDSVFNIYCIHQYMGYPHKFPNVINVYVDTTYSWTQQWQNLQIITGYSQLDSLLANYGFDTVIYFSSNFKRATLTTNQKINLGAIADSLMTFNGITSAFSYINGDGNEIKYSTNGSNKEFEFYLSYGDCPSGCIAHYIWKFIVFPDCSVLFNGVQTLGSTPEPFPVPVNCNLSSDTVTSQAVINYPENQIKIYPNPFNNSTLIEFENRKNQKYTLTLYNSIGQIVKQIDNITTGQIRIERDNLSNGLYFFQLRTDSEIIGNRKFIIE